MSRRDVIRVVEQIKNKGTQATLSHMGERD